jgi:type II secretory pathway pseudopilin PulG
MSDRRTGRGFTLVELTIGLFLGLLIIIMLGRIILTSQRTWGWGRDKVTLQQNVTEAVEGMARSVRAARTLVVVGDDEFQTYDEDSVLVHTYLLDGASERLLQDGVPLVDRKCTVFRCTPDDDTTSIGLEVELEDDSSNRVAAQTRAAIRNRSLQY